MVETSKFSVWRLWPAMRTVKFSAPNIPDFYTHSEHNVVHSKCSGLPPKFLWYITVNVSSSTIQNLQFELW